MKILDDIPFMDDRYFDIGNEYFLSGRKAIKDSPDMYFGLGSMDKKIKHLEMIENVIERMSRNCFTLKGWTMTLVALVGALFSQGTDKRFMLIGFVPITVFWLLDSFYLQLERRYRILYKEIAEKPESEIDFKMGTDYITVSGTDRCFSDMFMTIFKMTFRIILKRHWGIGEVIEQTRLRDAYLTPHEPNSIVFCLQCLFLN